MHIAHKPASTVFATIWTLNRATAQVVTNYATKAIMFSS